MARRRQIKFHTKTHPIHALLQDELSKDPRFANCDLSTLQILVLENKPALKIKDIDQVIKTLQRHLTIHKVPELENRIHQVVTTITHLAHILKKSRPTITQWINENIICKTPSPYFPFLIFELSKVKLQLINHQQQNKLHQ